MKSTRIGIVFLLFVLMACKKENPEVAPVKSLNAGVQNEQSASLSCNDAFWTDGNYDNGSNVRNNFSVRHFTSSSCEPTPLLIAIHGGFFTSGSKADMLPANLNNTTNIAIGSAQLLTESELSNNRIAYATINYRYATANGVHLNAPLTDCEKFVTYIRAHASEYNIDPNRIILMGYSAGASTALWLGLQDTLIKGVIAFSPQASLNVLKWQSEIFQPYNQNKDDEIISFFFWNNPSIAQFYYGLPMTVAHINQYSNSNNLHLLGLVNSSSPELMMATGRTELAHHACHLYALKAKYDDFDRDARIAYVASPYFLNPDRESIMQFCLRKF